MVVKFCATQGPAVTLDRALRISEESATVSDVYERSGARGSKPYPLRELWGFFMELLRLKPGFLSYVRMTADAMDELSYKLYQKQEDPTNLNRILWAGSVDWV